jgi:hypothetical protein
VLVVIIINYKNDFLICNKNKLKMGKCRICAKYTTILSATVHQKCIDLELKKKRELEQDKYEKKKEQVLKNIKNRIEDEKGKRSERINLICYQF